MHGVKSPLSGQQMKLAASGLCAGSLFQTVGLGLVRNGFDAWCAACGRMWNALMAIAIYIYPTIVNRMHGQTLFMFLIVTVGPVYCIFQLQMEFAQENVF